MIHDVNELEIAAETSICRKCHKIAKMAKTHTKNTRFRKKTWCANEVELVSKELNHLAAILHVYAGGLTYMK